MPDIDEFHKLARKAIAEGIIQQWHVDAIARYGTRKCGNWKRAIDDLQWFVEWKREKK